MTSQTLEQELYKSVEKNTPDRRLREIHIWSVWSRSKRKQKAKVGYRM